MGHKIYLTDEQAKVFKSGNMVITRENTYYSFPFWIKQEYSHSENIYRVMSPEQLPEDLLEFLNKNRQD